MIIWDGRYFRPIVTIDEVREFAKTPGYVMKKTGSKVVKQGGKTLADVKKASQTAKKTAETASKVANKAATQTAAKVTGKVNPPAGSIASFPGFNNANSPSVVNVKTPNQSNVTSTTPKVSKPTTGTPNVSNNQTQQNLTRDKNPNVPNSKNNSQVKGSQVQQSNSKPKSPNTPNNQNQSKPTTQNNTQPTKTTPTSVTQGSKVKSSNGFTQSDQYKTAKQNMMKKGWGTTLAGAAAGAIATRMLLGKNATKGQILAGAALGGVGTNMMRNKVNQNLMNSAKTNYTSQQAKGEFIRRRDALKSQGVQNAGHRAARQMQMNNKATSLELKAQEARRNGNIALAQQMERLLANKKAMGFYSNGKLITCRIYSY